MRELIINEFWGRMANQLWTVAALLGLAKKYGYQAVIPETWDFRNDFCIPDEFYGRATPQKIIREHKHGYIPDFLDGIDGDRVGIEGCFQSYLYWWDIKDEIHQWLRPRQYFESNDWVVGVHIRRGDYVNNPAYVQYGIDYYSSAMKKYFSDPRYVFNVVSDDMKYVRDYFQGERYITDTRDQVEDFTNLCACKHHVLSGSSYSFWGAFLSRGGGTTVRPFRTHAGKLAYIDESTSWLPEWAVHKNDQELVLICYADDSYRDMQNRLVRYATKGKQFDRIIAYTPSDIDEKFAENNKNILSQKRGAGYWLWKPYIILKTLKEIKDNDIVLYVDSGDLVFGDIRKFLLEQLRDRDIILTESGNIQKEYTKRDCFILMDVDGPEFWNAKQVEAGCIAIKNTIKSRKIIKDWLEWCEYPQIITDAPNKHGDNFDGFVDHRHDQSILGNIRVLHNLYSSESIRQFIACNVPEKQQEKIDLMDVTFCIPVKMDSEDRRENVETVVSWLQKTFDTNIIIGEQGSNRAFGYLRDWGVQYVYFDKLDFFHRTKMLNEMFVLSNTDLIFNHDGDVLLVTEAVVETVKMLRSGYPYVYPYNGDFLHVPRQYVPMIREFLTVDHIKGIPFKGSGDNSVGGSVAFSRDKFFFEDENFLSHAPEDRQRAKFMGLLGGYYRVDYPLYHLDHWCGPDSSHAHEYAAFNAGEWRRVKAVKTTKEALEYIKQWPWVSGYRDRIARGK